ncbi:MAG: tetratricopeptide repeat protein [Candidatus Sericytochromatia bacterium]|nr:tetratricopeptide repeat protein [Candidatus Sericytochromatia bacterium]
MPAPIRLFLQLMIGMTAISLIVPRSGRAGGPAATEPELPSRPERHAPPTQIEPGRPARPQPPPPEAMPGPMSRDQQRLFDGLRSEGIGLYRQGRYRESAERFRNALRIKPNDTVTQRWLRAAENNQR